MGHGFTIKPYIDFPDYNELTGKWATKRKHTSAEAAGYVIEVGDDTTYAQYTANGNKTNTEVGKVSPVIKSTDTKAAIASTPPKQSTPNSTTNNIATVIPTTAYWIEVHYLDENNQPVANLPFTVIDSTGKKFSAALDADGFAHVDDLSDGKVTIKFLTDYDKKVKKALTELNKMLKEALLHAHQETKMLQKEWDKTDWIDKPVILAGSLAIGIGDAVHELALSIVHLLQDFQKLLMGTGDWLGRYTSHHEQLHRAWDKGDIEGVKRAVAALEAMENELDTQIDNGMESGKIIASLAIEPSFYKTIITFSYDYINALHITAAVKLFPTVALNVALLLIGGTGAAKQGIKGAEKISAHLKQAAELFKRKKYKKTLTDEPVNTKVEIKSDGINSKKDPKENKSNFKKQTVISKELEEKILYGQRGADKNDIINNSIKGGHSGQIRSSNPLYYSVNTIETYSDGTRRVKYKKIFENGDISKLKTSTVFPENWTDKDIIKGIKQTGDTVKIATRARDGASLYQSTVNGVRIEVTKQGDKLTTGYPCGKACQDPDVFRGQ